MKRKRALRAAFTAFFLTICILLTSGAFLLVDARTGRTLFGDAYVTASLDERVTAEEADAWSFPWLPARLQVLLKIPDWEARVLEWFLSK